MSGTHDRGVSKTADLRFSLRTKLTLAFVLVSLIGFVVAFLLLPQLYVQSKEREIEASKAGNVQLLKTSFEASIEASGRDLAGLAQLAADRIEALSPFDLTGIDLGKSCSPEEFLDSLRRIGTPPSVLKEVDAVLFTIHGIFRLIRVIPWEVPPVKKKISFLAGESTLEHFVPILAPLRLSEEAPLGTLAVSDPIGEHELGFTIETDLPDLVQKLKKSGWLKLVSNILFFQAGEIPELHQSALEDPQVEYWSREDESGRTNLYVPVYGLREKNEVLGFFCLVYEGTGRLDVWRDLASGRTYSAFSVAALLAIAFSFFFVKGITRPIQDLTRGALAIADGDLDHSVKVTARDEIGVLARTFNEMRERLSTTLDQLRERAATIERQNVELDRRFNELRALQTYTENILRTVDSAIFSVDLEGRVRRPNRAAQDLLGLEDDREIEDFVSESLQDSLRAALDLGESTVSDEITLSSPEGGEIPMALSVSPLREGTTVTGAVAVLTDLQVIKNLEILVSRQERLAALGQLTAGVAHELRNPLSIIKACAEILQQKFGGQPDENGLCMDIVEEVDRLSRVVSDFLSFARPSEPNREPLDLNELIEITSERIKRTGELGVCINRSLAPTLPTVEADPGQVEQVLLNLIRNGAEAMNGAGEIAIRSGFCDDGETVWIEVGDSGEGMDEDTRRRIFDPFFTSKAEGTGLGLSICHRIMDSHDGSIQVVQTALGKGTVFRIAFPRSEREAARPIQGDRTHR